MSDIHERLGKLLGEGNLTERIMKLTGNSRAQVFRWRDSGYPKWVELLVQSLEATTQENWPVQAQEAAALPDTMREVKRVLREDGLDMKIEDTGNATLLIPVSKRANLWCNKHLRDCPKLRRGVWMLAPGKREEIVSLLPQDYRLFL